MQHGQGLAHNLMYDKRAVLTLKKNFSQIGISQPFLLIDTLLVKES
jgi:hypothetical protein